MHSVERLPLLMKAIKALSDEVEICVIEIGKKQHLTGYISPLFYGKKYKYKFVKYDKIFHRGWAMNVGVRELSTGSKIVLLDADVIVSPAWSKEIKECDYPAVAWGSMNYLTEESTQKFLNDDFKYLVSEKIKTPGLLGPAGGITIIDRKLFYEVKGVPENFEGTWGGEDNVLFSKLIFFGYPFRHLKTGVIHLYHSKSTPRNMNILLFAREMLRWTKKEWDIELERIGDNWGKI
jgi:predicted glycosyltransferase involved in capsule biosynthesis